MNRFQKAAITAGLALVTPLATLTGCGEPASDHTDTSSKTPAAASVPSAIFLSAAPADAMALAEAKSGAAPGDSIVFEARIGGRRDAFVENRAVFFVADSSLLSCDQLHGDSCKTPWDYCCEPRDNLLKHMATVQIVGDGGQPLKLSLVDEHGLAPLRTVFVRGTVQQNDESGNFVVNAEGIFVAEG